MDYYIDMNELLKGFDVGSPEFAYYDSSDGMATVIDSETGELLILEYLH